MQQRERRNPLFALSPFELALEVASSIEHQNGKRAREEELARFFIWLRCDNKKDLRSIFAIAARAANIIDLSQKRLCLVSLYKAAEAASRMNHTSGIMMLACCAAVAVLGKGSLGAKIDGLAIGAKYDLHDPVEYLDIASTSEVESSQHFAFLRDTLRGLQLLAQVDDAETVLEELTRKNATNYDEFVYQTLIRVSIKPESLTELDCYMLGVGVAYIADMFALIDANRGDATDKKQEKDSYEGLQAYLIRFAKQSYGECSRRLSEKVANADKLYVESSLDKLLEVALEVDKATIINEDFLIKRALAVDFANDDLEVDDMLDLSEERSLGGPENNLNASESESLINFVYEICDKLFDYDILDELNILNVARLFNAPIVSQVTPRLIKLNEYNRVCCGLEKPETRSKVEANIKRLFSTNIK